MDKGGQVAAVAQGGVARLINADGTNLWDLRQWVGHE